MGDYSYAWIVPTEMPIGAGGIISYPGVGFTYLPTNAPVEPQATFFPSDYPVATDYPVASSYPAEFDVSSYPFPYPDVSTFSTAAYPDPTSNADPDSTPDATPSSGGPLGGSGSGGSSSGTTTRRSLPLSTHSNGGSGSGGSGSSSGNNSGNGSQQQSNSNDSAPLVSGGVKKSGLAIVAIVLVACVL